MKEKKRRQNVRRAAESAVNAYRAGGRATDPLGSYTGNPVPHEGIYADESPLGQYTNVVPTAADYIAGGGIRLPRGETDVPVQDVDDL